MTRNVIVLGDMTTHSGRVITGSQWTDIHGKPVARIGDSVTCPKCGGIHRIVSGDPSCIVDGQPVAREGDYVGCGAKLISIRQQSLFTDTAGGGSNAGDDGFAAMFFGGKTAGPTDDTLAAAVKGDPSYWTVQAGQPAAGTQSAGPGDVSGAQWVDRFPSSTSSSDLVAPFRTSVEAFIDALRSAGATVTIDATLRPPERAYLMHYSWAIVHGADPRNIPSKSAVDIRWAHPAVDGTYDATASLAGAQAMVDSYGMGRLGVAPALTSRHIEGRAIDMSISWTGALNVQGRSGQIISITSEPRDGMNLDLQALGASYGVQKYVGGAADRPHWSSDGH